MRHPVRVVAGLVAVAALSATWVAPAQAAESTPSTMVTGNIDFAQGLGRQKTQAAYLVSLDADVIVLQETRELNLKLYQGDIDPSNHYRILQKWPADRPKATSGGTRAGSAIMVKRARYEVKANGWTRGYQLKSADPTSRYLPWARLRDKESQKQVVVISVHMPAPAKPKTDNEQAYDRMVKNYQGLVGGFGPKRAVIAGGDWNYDLGVKGSRPATFNRAAGLRIQGNGGDQPCAATRGQSRLDGFAVRVSQVQVKAQECLDRQKSDHRPVKMTFTVK